MHHGRVVDLEVVPGSWAVAVAVVDDDSIELVRHPIVDDLLRTWDGSWIDVAEADRETEAMERALCADSSIDWDRVR